MFNDISTALGSTYVNNFIYNDRTYRVYVQNDAPYRSDALAVARITIPNVSAVAPLTAGVAATNTAVGTTTTNAIGSGTATVPLASVVDISPGTGAPLITHDNLYRSVEIQGAASQVDANE